MRLVGDDELSLTEVVSKKGNSLDSLAKGVRPLRYSFNSFIENRLAGLTASPS